MALDTYANLQTAIATFAHRGDLAAVLPDLINMAEVRINGDIDARLQDVATTLTTTASVETVSIPTDLISMRHVAVYSTTPAQVLVYHSPDSYLVAHPYEETGTPRIYTVIGSTIYMSPIPDAAYTLRLIYKGRVPALSNSNPTNYILTTYPKVYVTAVMCEVAGYTKSDSLSKTWESQYKDAIDSVNSQDWFPGSTMRVKTDIQA